LVAKPVVGVVDLATNLSEGIKNTTTLFDDNDLKRERPPRHVSPDKVLHVYDLKKAEGQDILWNVDSGALAQENCLAQVDLDDTHVLLLLTESRIVSVDKKRQRILENVPFSNLASVKTDGRGTLSTQLLNNREGPSFSAFSTATPEDMYQFKLQLDDALQAWKQYRCDKS
jgi:vacuolar protein sorting-associated protein 13A/C